MARKRGLPSYPGSRIVYSVLSLFVLLEAIVIVGQAIFLARAITHLFQSVPLKEVSADIGLFFVTFLLRHLLIHVQQMVAERYALRTTKVLREKVTAAYFKLGPRFAARNGTGRLVTLAIEGIEQIKTYFEITILRMIRTFIIPAVLAVYIFTLDKASALIVGGAVPIIIIFMILLGMAAQKKADSQYATYRVLSNHFIDTLKGLETLTYLGKSKRHERKIASVSKEYRKATVQTLRIAFLSSFALDFFTSLSIAFVAVGLGLRLVDGSIILLPALTILILAPDYFLPIRQVGTDYHATLDGQVALSEVEAIIAQCEQTILPVAQRKIEWGNQSTLSLNDVTVEQDGHRLLNNIQFSWEGNGAIGIVGESGAGKSTLIDTIAGFLQPMDGVVEINGQQTTSLMREDWLEQVAYIPQHPYIFPTSIKENIRFYEKQATDAEVNRVIDEVGLRTVVDEMPLDFNEEIGEGGRRLSGGQEQRIAMARALLSKRPIILLDEPTAHLDIETEFEIKEAMLRLFKGKLIFLATHRLHWMKEMDHLLVLAHGFVVEQGNHAELLKRDGAYAELVYHHAGRGGGN